jgi:hypothetical protein
VTVAFSYIQRFSIYYVLNSYKLIKERKIFFLASKITGAKIIAQAKAKVIYSAYSFS